MKKKNKKKVIVKDPSIAVLFINKYVSDFNNDKMTVRELMDKVLRLFDRFKVQEVMELLPKPIIAALYAYGKSYKPVQDHPCADLGIFGAEVEAYNYTIEQQFNDIYRQWLMYDYFD